MYAVRRWSVRNARLLDRVYRVFEHGLVALHPILQFVGYDKLERPTAAIESRLKGFLFDCKMCGQCALSNTGMSCPMNCPKNIRNGPCGGVRADGNCEVIPSMRCVWIEAFAGNQRIGDPNRLTAINHPIDHTLWGRSSWLRVARQKNQAVAP
jgi:hypothetical protein